MYVPRLRNMILIAAAGLGLTACGYNDGYGYGGLSVGYGGGGYYRPYYGSYYGWYDDYYYPGIGFYIYDRRGYRHRWSDRHRRYWEGRRGSYSHHRPNWGGYRYQRRDYDGDGYRGDRYRSRDDSYRSRSGTYRSRGDNVRSDRYRSREERREDRRSRRER